MVKLRWKMVLIVSSGLLLIGGILALPIHIPLEEGFRTPATATVPSTPIIGGVEIVQQFPATGAPIAAIEVQLATYKRVNVGIVQLMVRAMQGDQWETLATKTIAKDQLHDNAFQAFTFSPPIVVKAGTRLAIAVTADGDTSQAISWWIDPNLPQPVAIADGNADSNALSDYARSNSQRLGYQLLVNGIPQPGMAVFSIVYAQESGPLITIMPELWKRLTIFLDPLWQALLLLGLVMIVLAPFWFVSEYLRQSDGR